MTFEPPLALDQDPPKILPPKDIEYLKLRKNQDHSSSSSGSASESKDREISDDDDDRNHKHRKRDSRPQLFNSDNQGVVLRRPIRRPNRTGENGESFNAGRLSEAKDERNASFDQNPLGKSERHSPGMASLPRISVDLGQRARANQSRNGSGSHIDLASFSRSSSGRGRGRGTGFWSQHDSRFGQIGTFDFQSQMAPRGPTLPGLFVGTSFPNTAGAQNASWGSFGFIPGMATGHLDPLHSLSLPGALHPSIGPPLNLGMPRQRCRDFEEQGFCLRGDMCPMEHGVNRIVVEDVQSLSQFNLSVSLPSSQSGGLQVASGLLPSLGAASDVSKNKPIPIKVNKSALDNGLGSNGVLTSSAGEDNDVYDPDQPLWNKDSLDPLSVPNSDNVEFFQDGDPLLSRHDKLPFKSDGAPPCANVDESSRGRSGSGSKPMITRRNIIVAGSRSAENDTSSGEDLTADGHGISTPRSLATHAEASQKIISAPGSRFHNDFRCNATRTSQKASRTLFVSCIPTKNNRRDSLLSHFQKFGTVVDIHIPRNGEKAFIQFSKREEAEAALESPEAVMGNRFIKLFWANRDNIVDDNEDVEEAATLGGTGRTTPVTLKPSIPGVVESLSSGSKPISAGTENFHGAPKLSSISTSDTVPLPAFPPQGLVVNMSKVTPVVQKKRDNLEMLKEELRKKQELFEQKRNEFKNQLEKLEKQRVAAKKNEATTGKPVKKLKVEKDHPNASDVNCLRESFGPEDSKSFFPVVLHSTENLVQNDKVHATSTERLEVDSQLFGFRILPPLPVDFADLAVIQDHFSVFQDLIRIDLEDPKAGFVCESCAIVLFSTIHSAEKAFSEGSCWREKKLKFSWLTHNSFGDDQGTGRLFPNTNIEEAEKLTFHSKLVAAGCSSSNASTETCSMMPEAVNTTATVEHMDVDVERFSLESTIDAKSTGTVESSDE